MAWLLYFLSIYHHTRTIVNACVPISFRSRKISKTSSTLKSTNNANALFHFLNQTTNNIINSFSERKLNLQDFYFQQYKISLQLIFLHLRKFPIKFLLIFPNQLKDKHHEYPTEYNKV